MILVKAFFMFIKNYIMVLALDISSSCIGYCVFNNAGKLLKMSCVKFNSKQTKFERLEKVDKIVGYLDVEEAIKL